MALGSTPQLTFWIQNLNNLRKILGAAESATGHFYFVIIIIVTESRKILAQGAGISRRSIADRDEKKGWIMGLVLHCKPAVVKHDGESA